MGVFGRSHRSIGVDYSLLGPGCRERENTRSRSHVSHPFAGQVYT
jgi:hypothetical protein